MRNLDKNGRGNGETIVRREPNIELGEHYKRRLRKRTFAEITLQRRSRLKSNVK